MKLIFFYVWVSYLYISATHHIDHLLSSIISPFSNNTTQFMVTVYSSTIFPQSFVLLERGLPTSQFTHCYHSSHPSQLPTAALLTQFTNDLLVYLSNIPILVIHLHTSATYLYVLSLCMIQTCCHIDIINILLIPECAISLCDQGRAQNSSVFLYQQAENLKISLSSYTCEIDKGATRKWI